MNSPIKVFTFLLICIPLSYLIPETVVFKGGKIRHVKVKKINLDTVFIINEKGKSESISKKSISKIVKKDRTGSESELLAEDEFLRREVKLKSAMEKEKENLLKMEREKFTQRLEKERSELLQKEKIKYDQKLEKEKSEITKKEKDKYDQQLKAELDKEHQESEKSFEAIKQKRTEDGKSSVSAQPTNQTLATSNYFFSPSDKVVALAGPDATCATISDKKQWFILFGTFPINKVRSAEIFKDDGQYRVYLKPTALDIFTSIFLGIFTSVTVKTVFIETCRTEPIYILNENEVNTLIHKKNEVSEGNTSKPAEEQIENKEVKNTEGQDLQLIRTKKE